jgi:hypothetical protein
MEEVNISASETDEEWSARKIGTKSPTWQQSSLSFLDSR